MEQFVVRKEHLVLLKHLNIDTHNGLPLIDEQKPFGNSNYIQDAAKILKYKSLRDDEYVIKEQTEEKVQKYLRELGTALQICLYFLHFRTGVYQRPNAWSAWEKVRAVKEIAE